MTSPRTRASRVRFLVWPRYFCLLQNT